jgi:phage baseplate assembly protein W
MSNQLPQPLIGWPLLPLPDEQGCLSYPTLEQSVRQSIEIILRTRPGEQLARPTFGAGLDSFLNEPNTLTTRRRIYDLVTSTLETWERRMILDRVEVLELPDYPARVRVIIAYRLRRTGALQQISLTMDLGG